MKELNIEFPKTILKLNTPQLAPWIEPKINFCFHMENFPKKETSISEIKSHFLSHKHDTNIDIYTDGSKTGNERVGAGLAILSEKTNHKTYLQKLVKNYAAKQPS